MAKKEKVLKKVPKMGTDGKEKNDDGMEKP